MEMVSDRGRVDPHPVLVDLILEQTNATALVPREVDNSRVWRCPYAGWRMLDKSTGESKEFDCKSWTCGVHGPLNKWRWEKRVSGVPWQLMLTITLVPEDRLKARVAWTRIARWLRVQGVTTYLRVMEHGRLHGMRHWHVLVQGTAYLESNALTLNCQAAGTGFAWVTAVRDRDAAVKYLLKYLFKDLGLAKDARDAGWRRVCASRNIAPWSLVQQRLAVNRGDIAPEGDYMLWKGGMK